MIKHLRFAFLAMLCACNSLYAQKEVSVNNFTGTASIKIPIINLGIDGVTHPIILRYDAKSIKVQGQEDIAVGWHLDAGGTIERVLKGFPDEKVATANDPRSGWMSGTNYADAVNLQIADDNDESTCDDESVNLNNVINKNPYIKDTEPDQFIVNAPGLNFTLVIDNNNVFRAIPAQDIKVEFIAGNPQTASDPYFIITTASGIKYLFRSFSTATKTVTSSYPNYDLLNTDYKRYKDPVTYITKWYLDEIDSPDGVSWMLFNYSDEVDNSSVTETKVNGISINKTIIKGNTKRLIRAATNSGQEVKISRVFEGRDEVVRHSISFAGKSSTIDVIKSWFTKSRRQVSAITESVDGCSAVLYSFNYYGNKFPFPTADSLKNIDSWGYYNSRVNTGKQVYVYPNMTGLRSIYRPYQIPNYQGESYAIGGDDALIDEDGIKFGLMSKITYPNGGSSTFEYESNSFWDEDANSEIKGAGVRIKNIKYFDGISPEKTIANEYLYNIPGQSRTSGTVQALPQFAITTNYSLNPSNPQAALSNADILALCSQQSAQYWKYHTLISNGDLSEGSEDVQYGNVTVKTSSGGRTEFTYLIPGNAWSQDNNSMVYLGSLCGNPKEHGLPVKKGFATYPFSYKEAYDYVAGLVIQVKMFTSSGLLVKKTDYEYEDYGPVSTIYGLGLDRSYGNLLFSKYGVSVNAKLIKKETETNYDSTSGTNAYVTENLYDNSAKGKKLRTKTHVNSDQSLSRVTYTYNDDFIIQPSEINADPFIEGIYLLNKSNIKNVVIEELTSKKLAQETEFKVYEGNLSLFSKNPINNFPVLSLTKKISSLSGLTNFNAITAVTSGNGKILNYAANYKTKREFDSFDNYNKPQSITENRLVSSFSYDQNIHAPLAEFSGAELKNIAYSSFNYSGPFFYQENSPNATPELVVGYVGQAGVIHNGNGLYKEFIKPQGAKFYTLSLWIKNSNNATVNVLLNNTQVTTISCVASDKYVFYQKQIDVTALSANSVIKLTSAADVNVDEIVFCPMGVSYMLNALNYPLGKASEINSSGKTLLYEYDGKGRPTYIRDGDRNILKRIIYQNYNLKALNLSPDFTVDVDPLFNVPAVFKTSNACLVGVKYKWDFGDGTILETYDAQVTHSFQSAGDHSVTLTASHPEFSTVTTSKRYTVPLDVKICASGEVIRDLCGVKPTIKGNCSSSYPAPSEGGAMVYLASLKGGSPDANYEYLWYRWSPDNTGGGPISAPNNQFLQPPVKGRFNIKLVVKLNGGIAGESNVIEFNFYNSQNCPAPL